MIRFLLFLVCVATAVSAQAKTVLWGANIQQALQSQISAPQGHLKYVHLTGQVTDDTQDALTNHLYKVFIEPLTSNSPKTYFEYALEVTGDHHFYWNFQVEPASERDVAAFNEYVSSVSSQTFDKAKIQFQNVRTVFLNMNLGLGVYQKAQDAILIQHEATRGFATSTLADAMIMRGTAAAQITAKNHKDFLGLFTTVLKDPSDAQYYKSLLTDADTVSLQNGEYLILDDNTVINPDGDHSATLVDSFIRNCRDQNYEGGMCESAPSE